MRIVFGGNLISEPGRACLIIRDFCVNQMVSTCKHRMCLYSTSLLVS